MTGRAEAEGSLFRRIDGNVVVPTDLARGPWDPTALHGGPVAALIALAIEELPDDGIAWFISRLTVDLERSVPVEPLVVEAEITRPRPQGVRPRGNNQAGVQQQRSRPRAGAANPRGRLPASSRR